MSSISPTSNSNLSYQRVQSADQDAQVKIAQSQKNVEEAEKDENTQIDKIKEEHAREIELEEARQASTMQAVRKKGYEQLRDLQRTQTRDFNQTRRDGEKAVLDVDLKEKDAIHEASKRGKQQLTDTQKTDAAMLDYETKNTKKTLESLEENQEKRVKTVNENAELKYSALNEARAKDYEKMRSSTIQATENARAKFEDKYQSTLAEQNTNLGDLETRASHQLNDIRADTAEKLSAYSTRQKDPFYKMKDVEAKVYDTGDTFMLVATVPEHEQQHISVTIRGNQLALTGYRRNEEKMEIGPGRGKSTSSFQSFSESFPLSGPVDSKLLSKSFDGDKLIVTVPKKPEFTEVAVYDKKTPDKVKVERPQFPENLPPGKYEARNSSKDETVEKSKKAENDSGTKPRSFAPLS